MFLRQTHNFWVDNYLNWRLKLHSYYTHKYNNASLSDLNMKKVIIKSEIIYLTTTDTPSSGFYSGTVNLGDFPEPLTSVPIVIGTMSTANGHTLLVGIVGTSLTSWGKAVIMSNAQRTNFRCSISLIAFQRKV